MRVKIINIILTTEIGNRLREAHKYMKNNIQRKSSASMTPLLERPYWNILDRAYGSRIEHVDHFPNILEYVGVSSIQDVTGKKLNKYFEDYMFAKNLLVTFI